MKLKQQTILITGATSGIGLELARALNRDENKIIILGRDQAKLTELAEQGFHTVHCDLASQSSIEQAVLRIQKDYPDINIVFNNAGIQQNYLITDTVIPIEKIASEININLTGQILFTHLMIPLLANQDNAYIINTTSGLGLFPKADGLVYSATKAALHNFTIGLRFALKDFGIQVLEFIPPVTDTKMTAARNEAKYDTAKLIQAILPQLKRDKKTVTITQIRIFKWISVLFPALANKILSKN